MMNERLDEAIDRVAADMTAVPPDAAFTTRLQSRLAAPASPVPLWLAVCAAAVLLTLVSISTALRPAHPSHHEASVVVAPVAVSPVSRPDTPEAPPHPRPETRTTRQGAARTAERAREPSEFALVELAAPQRLSVEDLSVESLIVAPVELHVLDLASLDVPALDASGEPKEPK